MSAVEDGCCTYPGFPSTAIVGASLPTFGPFYDQSVIDGRPAFTWTVSFEGPAGDTLVITATANVSSTNGFSDVFTLTSPDWIIYNATLVFSNFSGIDGPAASVSFDAGSVTFDTNNFGGVRRGSRFTAIVPRDSTGLLENGNQTIHLISAMRRSAKG